MQEINLYTDLIKDVKSGAKTASTRMGQKDFELGETVIKDADTEVSECLVDVTKITFKRAYMITDEDAQREGYQVAGDLQRKLKKIYPSMYAMSVLTIVEWDPDEVREISSRRTN